MASDHPAPSTATSTEFSLIFANLIDYKQNHLAISIRISFDYWQVSPLNSLCLPFVFLMWVFSSLEHFPTLVFGFLLLSEMSNLQESLKNADQCLEIFFLNLLSDF